MYVCIVSNLRIHVALFLSSSLPLSFQILRRGAHVNDKDGLTDLSLLHYASKAGAGMCTVYNAYCAARKFLSIVESH